MQSLRAEIILLYKLPYQKPGKWLLALPLTRANSCFIIIIKIPLVKTQNHKYKRRRGEIGQKISEHASISIIAYYQIMANNKF